MNHITFCCCVVFAMQAALTFAQGSAPSTLPDGRPAHYVTPPKTKERLFFLQRNLNQNTIVYDARLNPDGSFADDPIDVYWLRYQSTGERKELTWLQRTFAYGYSAKKDRKDGTFWITLTAYNGRKIHLQKDREGNPIATVTIDGKHAKLEYIWVFADNSSSWPKVLHVDLHGRDLLTGKPLVERIKN